jgi:type IV pilus assembly protein PilE
VKESRGFTLIELMIVVVVITILAAIAIPSYLSQTRRSRRSEVEGSVQQIALNQERFRADCSAYATAFSQACTGATTVVFPSSPYTSSYYTVTLPAVAGGTSSNAYTIKAVASTTNGSQSKDTASGTSCATLYYTFGVDTNVGTACGVTTAAGTLTKCPAACWSN